MAMATASSLRTVSQLWGADKVEHYGWADKGPGFCNRLCSAAHAVRDWRKAVVKLRLGAFHSECLQCHNESPESPVVSACGMYILSSCCHSVLMNIGHTFCSSCLSDAEQNRRQCPLCRTSLAIHPASPYMRSFCDRNARSTSRSSISAAPAVSPSLAHRLDCLKESDYSPTRPRMTAVLSRHMWIVLPGKAR